MLVRRQDLQIGLGPQRQRRRRRLHRRHLGHPFDLRLLRDGLCRVRRLPLMDLHVNWRISWPVVHPIERQVGDGAPEHLVEEAAAAVAQQTVLALLPLDLGPQVAPLRGSSRGIIGDGEVERRLHVSHRALR